MFRKARLQVVDLGAHLVKALVLEPSADGRLALVAAAALPLPDPTAEPDRHLASVERALAQLARSTLVRADPVHVLAPESLVRAEIASLASVPEGALADVITTDRARFLRTFGTRQRAFSASVRLKLARDGDTVDVTVAHAYARWVDLEHLHHQLRALGLTLGHVLPRALALRELVRRDDPAPDPLVIAEVGFTGTTLMRLHDGDPRRWKFVHAGGADLFRDVAGQLQRDQPLDGATFLAVMTAAGFTGEERRLADTALTEIEARGVARALRDRAAPFFTAVALGSAALFAGTDADGDPLPVPAHRILFTGGVAQVPGFLDAARTHLPAADLLRVAPALDPGPRTPSAPLDLFAACAGAARLLQTPDAAVGDVAREYLDLVRAHDAAAERWTPANPRFLRALAVTVLTLVAGTALWTQSLGSRIDDLTASIAAERATLESPATMKDLLSRFRDIRAKEALADAHVRYVELLLARRPDWAALVNRIGALAPPKALALTEVAFDVQWPRSDPPGSDTDPHRPPTDAKRLDVRVAGEADSLDTLRKFVGDLETQRVLTDLTYDSSARTPEGKAHGLEHHAHFAFTLTGTGDLSKDAEP